MPLRPLGEHGHLRDDVRAGLEVRERLAVLPRPLSPVRTPTTRPCCDEQLLRARLRQDRRAARLGLLGEEPAELRDRDDPVAVVSHRRRRRDPQRPPRRQQVDAPPRAPGRSSGCPPSVSRPLNSRRSARGLTTAPESRCEPGCLPFSTTRDRHVAEALGDLGMLLEQLAEPDRAGEPTGPAADDQHADLDPLVGRIRRRGDRLGARERRREVRRRGPAPLIVRLPARPDELGQLRHDLLDVADDAEVGELEDRRVRILVDRDDRRRSSASRPCAGSRPRCRSAM